MEGMHLVPESRMAAFQAGHQMSAGPLGGVFNRTGGIGGTSMSENAHHVAVRPGSIERAAQAESGTQQ